MSPKLKFEERRNQILSIANRYGVRNIRIVGSIARGDENPDSDIDFLIDMEPGRMLYDQIDLWDELQECLEMDVDLLIEKALPGELLSQLETEAKPI